MTLLVWLAARASGLIMHPPRDQFVVDAAGARSGQWDGLCETRLLGDDARNN